MAINPPQSQQDPKRNDKQSENTPGVKEQGEIAGASHANQGAWDTKEGKPLGPPKDGQVSKPLEKDQKDAKDAAKKD